MSVRIARARFAVVTTLSDVLRSTFNVLPALNASEHA